MGAFKGAVAIGAHAIETDVHLSKDGVVMISHVRFSCTHGLAPMLSLSRMLLSNDVLEKRTRSKTATGAT